MKALFGFLGRRLAPLVVLLLLASVHGGIGGGVAPAPALAAPTGNVPWAIVLCKFPDQSGEPETRSWLSDFFTESGKGKGGMYDYWAQASLGQVSLSGTALFPKSAGWYELPHPLTYYTSQFGQARYPIFNDCVSTAKSQGASFSGFFGTLVVTNGAHDDSALLPIGSGQVVINKQNLYVSDVAHEMGHGFGLIHGRDTASGNDYSDPYDIMSWQNAKSYSGTMGQQRPNWPYDAAPTGPGLNAPHLSMLGWMPANRPNDIYVYPAPMCTSGTTEVTLAPLERSTDTGYLMAKYQIGSDPNHYYTIEYRRRLGLDQGMNDQIVLLHEVRDDGYAYLVDSIAGNPAVPIGPEFKAGQGFTDEANNLQIMVKSTGETATIDLAPAAQCDPGPGGGGGSGPGGGVCQPPNCKPPGPARQ